MISTLSFSDITFVKLAREIAIEHHSLDDILERNSISPDDWDVISKHPRFLTLLNSEIVAWQGADNTHERVKLKAAALMELWLEEAAGRMHDRNETLTAKTELAKLVARLADMGIGKGEVGPVGERFSVTINLGASEQLKVVTSKVIDAEPLEGT